MTEQQLKIAVVGDIHEHWYEEDAEVLVNLRVDLVLFVGDLGNESVAIVRQIANLNIAKAVILGNHDAWFSATEFGRKKCPYDRTAEDRVQQQLDLLGECHVGYGKLDFPQWQLSVVGTRPFSWGGSTWKCEDFYRERYGVNNFAESTAKIIAQVEQTTTNNLILIGHNGPYGLGANPEDMCGRDWQPLGGDFGDPDFRDVICASRQLGKRIIFVTFGHMHHSLRHTKTRLRKMIHQDEQDTIYLNSASTPRVQKMNGEIVRNFSLVNLQQGKIQSVDLVWVNSQGKMIIEKPLWR
jgi:uncharacterized protein (TIGR04168 family)